MMVLLPLGTHRVRCDWGVPLDLGGGLTVTPAAHLGWTDLHGEALADGYPVWLSLGSSLAL
jgi:hypothetical protein